jgi:putative flippase GtrA
MSLQSLVDVVTKLLKRKLGRFILVGVVGAIVEIGFFSGLIQVGIGLILSNLIAFHFAFALCFYLHYHYTHQKPYEGTRKVFGGFVKYAGLMYAQLIVGTLLLWFFIDKLGWIPEVAKTAQIGIVTPASYIIQKLIIFRRRVEI